MIRLYSGTPGSGKSLHNARDVINRSRFGRPVIGNFPCDLSRYPKANYLFVPNHELTPELLIRYSKAYFAGKTIKEGAILVVMDECQLLFNSRDWQQKGRNEWLSFFTQHRKYGFDITLIAQFDRMIDRQIRSLVEYEFIHRKMSNFGIGGKLLSLVCGGNTFVAVQMWYPLHLKVGSELFHARKYLYSIYDTYGTFDASTTETQCQDKNLEIPQNQAIQPSLVAPIQAAAIAKISNFLKKRRKLSPDHAQPKNGKKYVGFYSEPYRAPLTLQKLAYRGKFVYRFPENRDEMGWKKTRPTV